jgi:hypothetical protein
MPLDNLKTGLSRPYFCNQSLLKKGLPHGQPQANASYSLKLLNKIFQDARDAKQEVKSIDMSEMFWRDFAAQQYTRAWSTGQIVPSCDTCKQILPQILCNIAE